MQCVMRNEHVNSQAAQAHVSRKSKSSIHEASRIVWLGAKLRELNRWEFEHVERSGLDAE